MTIFILKLAFLRVCAPVKYLKLLAILAPQTELKCLFWISWVSEDLENAPSDPLYSLLIFSIFSYKSFFLLNLRCSLNCFFLLLSFTFCSLLFSHFLFLLFPSCPSSKLSIEKYITLQVQAFLYLKLSSSKQEFIFLATS